MNGQTLSKAFVPLPGGAQAVYTPGGLIYFRHSDWLGSSRFASTPTRTCYSDLAYAPFGEGYAANPTLTCPNTDLDFTGQNQDTIAGMYDFFYREYAPTQGRWISPDPAGQAVVDATNPQTWNRYAYVTNAPLNAVDPQGLAMCTFAEDGTLLCGGYGGGGGGYGSGLATPGYNPGYCGPWNASCADGRGYYGNIPEWVLTGHWSKAAMKMLMAGNNKTQRPYLSVTYDHCDALGRDIHYKLNGTEGYVWETLTFSDGGVANNTQSATKNGYPDFISGFGVQTPISQRFVMSSSLPKSGAQGTPLQIQQNIGGWNVMLNSQIIQRTNDNIYVASKPCPK